MNAAVLYGIGDLRFENYETPLCADNQTIIAVKYCGICGSDLPRYTSTGSYDMPKILGHEFMGEVVGCGALAKNVKVGDRVAINPLIPCKKCNYCVNGMFFHCTQYKFLGSRIHGGWAEFVAVPSDNLIAISGTVGDKAGSLLEPITVAFHCVKRMAVKPGQHVVVFGAGAIGILIAQWAKSMGAEVVIVDIRKKSLDIAAACGISLTVDASEGDITAQVLSKTNHHGADITIEAAGARQSTLAAFEITANRGKVGLVGRICGSLELSQNALEKIQRKELCVQGLWGFDSSPDDNDWTAAAKGLSEGKIVTDPLITHIYPLAQARDAIEMMTSGKDYFCKVLLEIRQE